jgi:hypothetical protein
MTVPSLSGLAPLRLGSTVLAAEGLTVSPDIAEEAFQHSGNEFPSVMQVYGAAPRVRFRTPFAEAYTLFGGLRPKTFTTLDAYLANFASGLRDSASTHHKFALTAACSVFAYIRSLSVSNRRPLMAEVEAVYLSSTGVLHPWTRTDNNAMPTLSAEPALLTMGPNSINGSVYAGAMDFNIDFGHDVIVGIDGMPGDGLLYPTVAQFIGGKPMITTAHGDPMSIMTALGFTGLPISANFIQYFRGIDPTTQLVLATGYSLTMALGRVSPIDFGANTMRAARGGFKVTPLSVGALYPVIVASGQAVPTP